MRLKPVPAVAIALWLYATVAVAQSSNNSKAPVFDPAKSGVKVIFAPRTTDTPGPALAAGQRAHVDQQGKLREADPQESKQLNDEMKAQVTPSVQTAVPIYGPGGTVGIQLGEEYMEATVAAVGPDGKLRLQCVPAKNARMSLEPTRPVSVPAGKEAADVR